ncbi:ATP-binding protein [Algoriphagus formosus]|uniref:histidine kinase n=1 Tax=Algoriphagus formosus TaxID=2007308 RepID=A0A4R5V0Q9_9BACT|nr:ATP-binding protein [Algoriphagus aquimaris]TDK45338.1 GHKL domain-containing protein [Algoriphagus aquimaris]
MRKEKEQSLNQAYQEFIEIGLNIRPIIDELKHLIDPKIMGFGTTEDERIFSRQEFIDLIKRQEEQAVGIKLEHEVKPIHRRVLSGENSAIYVDDLIMRITTDSGQFEMKMRFSMILEYQEKKWIVVHWHGSKPEEVKSEEDTWGIDIWKKKTEELEQIVSEKTADLVEKNRELEIEAALERVRAVAMGMKKPEDMLSICRIISEQLQNFGVTQIRNIQTAIIDEEKGIYLCYQYFTPYDQEAVERTEYLKSPVEHGMVRQMLASKDGHFTGTLAGKELDEFREHRKAENHFSDPLLDGSDEISYCFLSIGEGGLGLTIYQSLDKQTLVLFKRFHQVFSLAYQRFRDIQKAEAQARESDIQLALERVRARTMAMQHSDELTEASQVLDQQVRALGIDTWGCAFHIYADDPEGDYEWFSSKAGTLPFYKTPRENFFLKFYEKGKAGETFHVEEFLGEACKAHYEYIMTIPVMGDALREVVASGGSLPESQYDHIAFFKHGFLLFITYQPVPEAHDIFQRFSKVFEQTYTRFLDLQKAEAQAREAQIEAALERVRSRSMAMHKTEELADAIGLLQRELSHLEFALDNCIFWIINKESNEATMWLAPINDTHLPESYQVPFTNLPYFNKVFHAWKLRIPNWTYVLEGEDKKRVDEYLFNQTDFQKFPTDLKNIFLQVKKTYIAISFYDYGGLHVSTETPINESQQEILSRFSKVFNQTYTRFLDLQKAEVQAREAQIQLALERVRAKTMAMNSQSDLLGIIEVFGQQLSEVNVRFTDVTFIEGPITKNRDWELWSYIPGTNNFTHKVNIPYLDISYFTKTAESVEDYEKTGKSIQTKFFTKEEKDEFLDHYWKYAPGVPEKVKELVYANPGSTIVDAFLENVTVSIVRWDLEPFTEEDLSIFERFAKEFKQTYTRYLDIKKAEAQAREAKIEVALEKVRSRTMGMQKAEELGDVATLLFNELNTLVDNLWTCGFVLCEKDRQEDEWWLSADNGLIDPFFLPNIGDYAHESLYEGWKKGESYRTVTLEGPQLQEHYDWLLQIPIAAQIFEEMEGSGIPRPTWQRLHAAYFKTGYLVIITEVPCEEEDIFKRFAQVFDLTYTRFLDLKKAENQAREAQIEAVLEKVRSRSLAMQDPEELTEVAQLLREEMGILGVEELETSSIYIHDKTSNLTQCWFTIKNSHNPARSVSDQMVLDLQDTWVGQQMLKFYRSKEKKTSILMKGEQRVEWIRYCESKSELLGKSKFYGETIPERTYHLYKFSDGFLGAASSGPISAESWDLMRRATAVFSFAFTRFLDLQRAQASAKEARRQASLDRVRADISSMRTAADLDKITPLLFKELTTLDIPFIRCGVFIINEKAKIVEAYLSSPEGKSLGVLHLPFDASELTFQTVEAWRKGEVYRQHWDKEDFLNWIQQIMEKDLIQDEKTYQGAAAPPESLNLHFVPFTQGMLYVGSTEPLSEDEIDLIRSLSEAFAIAYSRYEDFVKLEKAKAEIESAMSELKATQTQLVQQEKLASLGQLTAGIAHEIKNPLNFVNNFSEVSNELIDEAFEELEKLVDSEEKEEIIAILEDVKGNLSKVQEHGKRANGIVTSMLQHSRGGDGKMEPTDLNALLKEYVNLSFHGMRAGKNPINVNIDLQLEEGIGKVNLISEDFSRVIVNLCNNAFDAMRQKTVEVPDSYQPKLTVRTKSEKNQVFIEVEDNGPGIPDEIKDKILQPFFTTKKGTEGTGLGLSITNDIIKAHGGSLDVESNQNGSKFVISLPQ